MNIWFDNYLNYIKLFSSLGLFKNYEQNNSVFYIHI